MNQREAKRRACSIAAADLRGHITSGSEINSCDGDECLDCPDCERIKEALLDLCAELDRRAEGTGRCERT